MSVTLQMIFDGESGLPLKGNEFIREIKERPDTTVFEATPNNRDRQANEICQASRMDFLCR